MTQDIDDIVNDKKTLGWGLKREGLRYFFEGGERTVEEVGAEVTCKIPVIFTRVGNWLIKTLPPSRRQ